MLPSVKIAGECRHNSCSTIAIGDDAYCEKCRRALCRVHYDADEHACRYAWFDPMPVADIQEAIDDLDQGAIIRRAEEHRPGHTCEVQLPAGRRDLPLDMIGGYNIHLTLLFYDGVEWLLRIPGYPIGPAPPTFARRVRNSEAITYDVLRQTGIPVAEIQDWGCGVMSKIRNPHCAHIIYSRMPGAPDHDLDWVHQCPIAKLRRLVDQYVSITTKLSTITFDAIGSLDRSCNGDLLVDSTTDFMYCDDQGRARFSGPFFNLKDRYLAVVDHLLEATRKGRLYRSGLLLPYLRFLELRRFLESRTDLGPEEVFYMTHPDLHSLNILTDSHDITALVDWEWATTTTKAEAFASPVWLRGYGPQLSIGETMLCEAYIKAGRHDLADCVRGSRLYHDIRDAIHLDFKDEEFALGILNSVTIAPEDSSGSTPADSLQGWAIQALDRHSDEPHLQDIIALDHTLEVTRRPALMKEWNPIFGPRPIRWTPCRLREVVYDNEAEAVHP